MNIEFFEFSQQDNPHLITRRKADRLVHELKVAVYETPNRVRAIVAKSWSVIKLWLSQSAEQRIANERRAEFAADFAKQLQARAKYPNGSEFGFAPWPSKDLRTI